jgi:hypothetical protein
VLSALEHAHRAGVVHRDIKPANVMVTDEGGIKIMDFGIARVLGAEQKTVDFRLMGTPAYMSPEQVMGEGVDGRSDLYSVGVLFYRLLAGALPFAADTALGMLQRQIRDTPIPLQAHRSGLPDWCDRIVQRALAKVPADRFQSAEEFRDALSRATGPLPMADLARTFAAGQEGLVPAQPINQTIDLSRQDAALAAASQHTLDAAVAPPPRSRFAWAQAAMVIVAMGAVGVGYLSLRERNSAPVMDAAELPAAPPPVSTPEPVESEPVTLTAEVVPPVAPEPVPAAPPVAAPAARRSSPRPAPVEEELPPPPAPVAASEPVDTVERRPVRITVEHEEPSLVFETRALVGTRKPREQGAQLVLGEGRITIIPQEDPTTPLCSFAYGRVLSINVSRNRDPLWNSPQGPAPVARAGGGALSRLGFQGTRHWIALRTSTEEQFVAIRFDEVLLKRVLLALEERTGRRAEFIELPKEKDDDR